MLWRGAVTAIVWILGFACRFTDGQTYRNAITLLATAIIGCGPWILLVLGKDGTRGRSSAMVIVFEGLKIIALFAIGLPEAYEFQKRINERLPVQ